MHHEKPEFEQPDPVLNTVIELTMCEVKWTKELV